MNVIVQWIQKICNSFAAKLNFNLQGFGFDDWSDYIESSFHFKAISMGGVITIVGIGTISTAIERYIGMTPIAYLGFVFLIIAEIATGVLSSIKEGDKVRSRKMGRMIIKIGTYTMILGFLQTFKIELKAVSAFGFELNIYEWIYYVVLNMIILQLLISLFENLDRLGYTETNAILKVLKRKFKKWFLEDDIDDYQRRNK